MFRIFKIILCSSLLMFMIPINSSFAIDNVNLSLTCDNVTPIVGEEFSIYLVANSSNQINISSFRLKIKFDHTKLSYKGFYSDINMDDFKSYSQDDDITLLYVTSENGTYITNNPNQILVELNFKVLSSAKISNTTVSAYIDGLCNYNAQEISASEINPLDITIAQSGSGNCDLLSLNTNGYKLYPNFSSDIVNYSVEVPYSKSNIEFNAEPVDQDSTVKISRKTLKTPGTPTDISITVTSSDKKSRKVYKVTVNRLTKEESKTKKLNNIESPGDVVTDESINSSSHSNNSSSNQSSDPLIVKENSFNLFVFIIASAICIVLCIVILRYRNTKHS